MHERREDALREAVARELGAHLGVVVDEPGAAELDDAAVEPGREGAPADALPRLEDEDAPAGVREVAGRPEAGEAGADDDGIEIAGHGADAIAARALTCARRAPTVSLPIDR